MRSLTIQKFSNWSLLAALVILPVIGYAAYKVQFGTAYVEGWLPAKSPVRTEYRRFINEFGADQYLIVSWKHCVVDDPRLTQLALQLRQLSEANAELAILSVRDSRSEVNAFVERGMSSDAASALKRLRGYSVGEDGTAFILIQLGDAEIAQRSELISAIEERSLVLGVASEDLVLAGEPYQVHMIDRSSRETIQYFVAPSSILALCFAWICLRSLPLTVLVFAFAGVGQLIGLALISICFGEMSAVMVVLPTLIFMLTLSAAVHLTSYFRDAGGVGVESSGIQALKTGVWPCGLATLTTVFGFGSLVVSQLNPVWQFGALAAAGLLASTAILLSIFPAATQLVRRYYWPTSTSAADSHPRQTHSPNWLMRLARGNQRFSLTITCTGIFALIWAAVGVTRMRTSTEFVDMFPADHRAVQNLDWVESRLGPIESVEILATFKNSNTSPLLERLGVVRRISDDLEALPAVYRVLSATTFLPEISDRKGTRSVIQRALLRRKLEDNYTQFIAGNLANRIGDAETWRLTVRLKDLRSDEFEITRDALLACAQASLNTYERPDDVVIRLTGLRTVVETAHKTLLWDLGSSFAAAFLLITPVMMWISRGLLSGIVLMIPNVLPVLLVFGGMGWLEIRLDVASILTASVALGIAVDDTLHFMSWYFRCRREGQDAVDASGSAMAACARPMLHTTVICAGAMLPFFFSDFLPTSKFALLMILILAGAILGDLILLPAILMSPFGRLVGKTGRNSSA